MRLLGILAGAAVLLWLGYSMIQKGGPASNPVAAQRTVDQVREKLEHTEQGAEQKLEEANKRLSQP
jgi:threonine/homoserine/homoserine lactone efflux protein